MKILIFRCEKCGASCKAGSMQCSRCGALFSQESRQQAQTAQRIDDEKPFIMGTLLLSVGIGIRCSKVMRGLFSAGLTQETIAWIVGIIVSIVAAGGLLVGYKFVETKIGGWAKGVLFAVALAIGVLLFITW